VNNVFALQLMQVMSPQQPPSPKLDTYPFQAVLCSLILHANQVSQVTEDAALAVTHLYPTVFSLAQAYSMLVSPVSLPTYAMLFSFTTPRSYSESQKSKQMQAIFVSRRILN
jgi:hypothetical protein